MNLYLISQDQNQEYDTYDSAVVAADSEDEAREIHPDGGKWLGYSRGTWCKSPDDVKVTFLCAGYNGEAGVVLASFNAG